MGLGGLHLDLSLSHSPVYPAEDLGVVWVCGAEGDAVGPVLGQAVLLRHRFQALVKRNSNLKHVLKNKTTVWEANAPGR